MIPYPINKLLDKLLESLPMQTRVCASIGIALLLTSRYWTELIRIPFFEPELNSIILLLTTTIITLIAIMSYTTTFHKKQTTTDNNKHVDKDVSLMNKLNTLESENIELKNEIAVLKADKNKDVQSNLYAAYGVYVDIKGNTFCPVDKTPMQGRPWEEFTIMLSCPKCGNQYEIPKSYMGL